MMACQENHPFLMMAINKIVDNVETKYYGSNSLEPTGPIMLGNLILNNKLKLNLDMTHYKDGGYVIYKNRFVLSTEYPEYNSEMSRTYNLTNKKKYYDLWNERNIYL
jgi:hypothetical protein